MKLTHRRVSENCTSGRYLPRSGVLHQVRERLRDAEPEERGQVQRSRRDSAAGADVKNIILVLKACSVRNGNEMFDFDVRHEAIIRIEITFITNIRRHGRRLQL